MVDKTVMTRPTKTDWGKVLVASSMTRDVTCAGLQNKCNEAARVLLNAGVYRAVVIDTSGRPIGALTTLDFTEMVAQSDEACETEY